MIVPYLPAHFPAGKQWLQVSRAGRVCRGSEGIRFPEQSPADWSSEELGQKAQTKRATPRTLWLKHWNSAQLTTITRKETFTVGLSRPDSKQEEVTKMWRAQACSCPERERALRAAWKCRGQSRGQDARGWKSASRNQTQLESWHLTLGCEDDRRRHQPSVGHRRDRPARCAVSCHSSKDRRGDNVDANIHNGVECRSRALIYSSSESLRNLQLSSGRLG